MVDETTDELIRAAYGLVSKPQRLIELLEELQDDRTADDETVVPLSAHFARITELIDEIDPNIGDSFGDFDPVERESADNPAEKDAVERHSLVLDYKGKVVDFDPAIFTNDVIEAGRALPPWMTDIDTSAHRKLKTQIVKQELEEPLFLRLRLSEDDAAGHLFAAEPSSTKEGVANLRMMRLRWQEQNGAVFAKVLRLTDTEKQLAQYIIDGLSIRQFAEARGRSLGTARNQLKALLKKLGLASQIELVSLYAGFQASMLAIEDEQAAPKADGQSQVFNLPCGNILPYELHGDPKGRPVIYLHATADGAYLTKAQDKAARANGLRIIAPWLPFYAGSKLENQGLAAVDEYLDRLLLLLDELNIAQCPIVTVRVSAPYGFRAVQRHKDRFTALVTAGAVVPAREASDFSHLAIGYRAPMRLARAAPSFVKLYFAATASMVRKGQGAKFFRSLYGRSPADLAVLEIPEVIENIRLTLQRTFEDGYESTLQQTLLSASDWSAFCEDIDVSVKMVCGQEDGLAPPEKVSDFAQEFGFDCIGPLENVGSLAIHQVPRLVFDTVARWGESKLA